MPSWGRPLSLSPVLHTAHIMHCIKYLLVFVRQGLHFLQENNQIRIENLPFYASVCVFRMLTSYILPFLTHLYLTHSSSCVFLLNQSSAKAFKHTHALTHINTNVYAHAPLQHLRACSLHFRRHIIHRPRGKNTCCDFIQLTSFLSR